MIQRIFEAIAGVLAAVTGLWLLFSVESAFFPTTPAQSYGVSGQPAPPLAWIPAFQVFTIALVGSHLARCCMASPASRAWAVACGDCWSGAGGWRCGCQRLR